MMKENMRTSESMAQPRFDIIRPDLLFELSDETTCNYGAGVSLLPYSNGQSDYGACR